MLFLLVATLFTRSNFNANILDTTTSSSNLISDLRRQLMANNYDYLPTETEEDFPLNRQNVNDRRSPEKIIDDYDYHAHDKIRFKVASIVPRVHEDENKKEEDALVSNKDLLYYMNDERIGLVDDNIEEEEKEYKNVTSPKVKYKVIKVKSAHPNRRSLISRRFLQERGQDGVAIMALDDQPFPEFRLPKSRRQYMQDTSEDDTAVNFAEDFSLEEAKNKART